MQILDAMPTEPPLADQQAAFDRELSSLESVAEIEASPAPTTTPSPLRR